MNLNLSDLKELFELMAERNITDFELEEEGVKLRIKQGGSAAPVAYAGPLPEQEASAAAVPSAPAYAGQAPAYAGQAPAYAGQAPAYAGQAPAAPPADAAEEGLSLVTAPMVGTFYLQPELGAEPFARKGDRIAKGQIVCIIEAMKLMNEIESELSGELAAIYVENGQPVQYGDKLFAIRES